MNQLSTGIDPEYSDKLLAKSYQNVPGLTQHNCGCFLPEPTPNDQLFPLQMLAALDRFTQRFDVVINKDHDGKRQILVKDYFGKRPLRIRATNLNRALAELLLIADKLVLPDTEEAAGEEEMVDLPRSESSQHLARALSLDDFTDALEIMKRNPLPDSHAI